MHVARTLQPSVGGVGQSRNKSYSPPISGPSIALATRVRSLAAERVAYGLALETAGRGKAVTPAHHADHFRRQPDVTRHAGRRR